MPLVSAAEFSSQPFDYLIVGGGTAGLAVAARLSEDIGIKVGVIEAGSARLDDEKINTPGLSTQLWANPDYDWMLETTPQVHANNQVVKHTRGRVLGGSSAVNLMMWSQSTRRDIDNWRKLGNSGWGWDDLLPYYQKAETFHQPSEAAREFYRIESEYLNASLRGTNGPIQTSLPDKDDYVSKVWTETCKNAGFKTPLSDPRSGSAMGGFNQLKAVDPRTGRRSYSASAYFKPNESRSNLLVVTDSLAERITIVQTPDGMHTATGVDFSSGDKRFHAQASREIIVSCGTFLSPKLLELSGIGSASILSQHGVEVKIDNPNVGENLQDHVCGHVAWGVHQELATHTLPSYMTNANLSLKDITPSGQGQLELSKGIDAEKGRERQYQLLLESANASDQAVATFLGHATGPTEIPILPAPIFVVVAALSNPFSLGTVHIKSADPRVPPAIDPNYYSHPNDITIMSHALLRGYSLGISQPLSGYLLNDGHQRPTETLSPEAFAAEAKAVTTTMFHPLGTCAMMPKSENGVVNERLVVYGTKNLRVVDASIMPMHVQGNIMNLVYAVAEKAADLIKEDRKRTG